MEENRKQSIPSPYNFVPLSKEIFFPEWAEKVSQDVPFEDGKSGSLGVVIKTESPIYIRNGGAWTERDKKDSSKMNEFCQAYFRNNEEAEYFIPGTSLKGMIRNVLEIASFGKMGRVANHRYSIRDLNNRKLYISHITKTENGIIQNLSMAGWLYLKDDNKWCLSPCKYARVEQELLDPHFGTRRETAVEKYKHFKKNLKVRFSLKKETRYKHSCGMIKYDKVESFNGDINGTLVFTGQPSKRIPGKQKKSTKRKHMEFVFYESSEKIQPIDITHLKKDFEFIHSDDNGNPNTEWKYWKKKLKQGEKVPVFYLTKNHRQAEIQNPPSSIGLAMMYRLPYKCRIHDAIKHTSPEHLSSDKPDLSDLIFGYISEKNQKTLRGRVHIGHSRETDKSRQERKKNTPEAVLVQTVLGGPKPSYYPNYIKQNNNSGYSTFMDKDCELRGWKRYPIREEKDQPDLKKLPQPPGNNEKVMTRMKPLPKGLEFEGIIRYHNLKPIELGALLWALTWGGHPKCQHAIGMAKPLGLGRVSIRVQNIDKEKLKKYYEQFTDFMDQKLSTPWKKTEQIQELRAMANHTQISDIPYSYPFLKNSENENDFSKFKKAGMRLFSYKNSCHREDQNREKSNDKKNVEEIKDPLICSLINKIESLRCKDLIKEIKRIDSIKDFEYERLMRKAKKRGDYKNATNPQVEDYRKALESLKEKIK